MNLKKSLKTDTLPSSPSLPLQERKGRDFRTWIGLHHDWETKQQEHQHMDYSSNIMDSDPELSNKMQTRQKYKQHRPPHQE